MFIFEENLSVVVLFEWFVMGLYYFVIFFLNRKEFGIVFVCLIEYGIVIGYGDYVVSEVFYLFDFDGNGIEMYVDCFCSMW